ncbi:MAG: hypothetical protein AAFO04_15050 [Cyanobacteria bacterium J06592_8]
MLSHQIYRLIVTRIISTAFSWAVPSQAQELLIREPQMEEAEAEFISTTSRVVIAQYQAIPNILSFINIKEFLMAY